MEDNLKSKKGYSTVTRMIWDDKVSLKEFEQAISPQ